MRFSIIVPVFMQEAYIASCVDSLLAQGIDDMEVLLIDDGSTDSTPRICDELAAGDSRVRVIHKQNEGPSATRNLGVSYAFGDYIVFVDGDDMLAQGALLHADAAARQHNEPDLVVCCIDKFTDDTADLTVFDGVDALPDRGTGDELAVYVKERHNKYSISPCRYAIKRSFYLKNKLSFMPGLKQEDELFSPLLICAAESFAVCRGRFYLYRMHGISRNSTLSIKNKIDFLKISYSLLESVDNAPTEQKKSFLLKRGKYLFGRGLMEHNENIKKDRALLVNTAVEVYRAFPAAAEDMQSLVKLIKLFGCERGISCFIRLLGLINRNKVQA